jgi:hypothetical protein
MELLYAMKVGQVPVVTKKPAIVTVLITEYAKMELVIASKGTQEKNVSMPNVPIYVITTDTVEKTADVTASQVSRAILVMNFI